MLKKLSYEKKKSLLGYFYISPWLLGFTALLLIPMVQSLLYTFSEVTIESGRVDLSFVGLSNYEYVLRQNATYVRYLVESLYTEILEMPLILILSLIVSLLLNQKFRGQKLFRCIFFLPVIIASGAIIQILKGDALSNSMMSGESTSALFQTFDFQQMLYDYGLPEDLVQFAVSISDGVFELIWKSGIQILLFIAGLQAIPNQLYEVASIEGASAWETFWKVTFPMVGPVAMVNLVYTVSDAFMDQSNITMNLIVEEGRKLNYAYSATMAWIYFAVVFIVIGVVYFIVDRKISYVET